MKISMKRMQAGFAHIGLFLIIALIAVIGLAGWYVSGHHKTTNNNPTICTQIGAPTQVNPPGGGCKSNSSNPPSATCDSIIYDPVTKTQKAVCDSSTKSYEDCINSPGSKMIETYPQQCVDSHGGSWPNPAQVNDPDQLKQ